ncbi:hypothetical protein KJB35_01770 [Vibrio sp. D431a]|nr:hypothetical protein [Vibrio sp. D431a]
MFKKGMMIAALTLSSGAFANTSNFDFQLDTVEAKRALETCNNDLTITFEEPSNIRIICNGVEELKGGFSGGKAPLFDEIRTLNSSVLVGSQTKELMKTFSPNLLRGYYNGWLAEFTESYLLDMAGKAANLKLWEGYI